MKRLTEIAREAGGVFIDPPCGDAYTFDIDDGGALERFATLIRADERNSWPAEMEAMERQVNILTDALAEERERMKWDVHSCGPTCKRYACVAMREAVEAEREMCASECDEWIKNGNALAEDIAAAIRARGSNT